MSLNHVRLAGLAVVRETVFTARTAFERYLREDGRKRTASCWVPGLFGKCICQHAGLLERAAVVADMNPGLFTHKGGAAAQAVRRGGAMQAVDTMNHFS